MGSANPMRARDRRPWRRLRLLALALACALLLVSAVSSIRQIAHTKQSEVDNLLHQTADQQAAAIAERFREMARIDLLLARNPVLGVRTPDQAALESALSDVLSVAEDSTIGAALIRSDGRVYARVVNGAPRDRRARAAKASELDHLAGAMDIGEGLAFHSAPYRSAETGRWVVTTAARVSPRGGGRPRFALIETDLGAFRTLLASTDGRVVSRIVRPDGTVIANSRIERHESAPPGPDADQSSLGVAAERTRIEADRQAFRFARIEGTPTNANAWHVAASAPVPGRGFWLLAGGSATVMAVATLMLLVLGVTAFRRRRDDLHVARMTDPLSGLPNRAALAERGEEVLAHGRADGYMTAVLCLNLYRFREVNDGLGHAAGDSIITAVSGRLREAIRDGDLLVRLGGDEFAVLLSRVENREGAIDAARRILAALHAPFDFAGSQVGVHAVMGAAIAPVDGEAIDELIARAGAAMYEARRRARDLLFFEARMNAGSAGRLSLVSDLRAAMETDELRLHYQPKVSLRNGMIEGVEALVRWQHPRLGLLTPAAFIPLAEDTGLIDLITHKTLTLALAQSRAWLDEGLELKIALNLSHRAIESDDIVAQVAKGLTRWQVPPRLLELEIGAQEIARDSERAGAVMRRLSDLGVGLVLDDYGAGESSLMALRSLPVDAFKIDRRFIREVTTSPAVASIVRATIDLGQSSGMRVVAEGVADRETVGALVGGGCDAAQGSFFCDPLPADDLRAWLAARQRRPDAPRVPR